MNNIRDIISSGVQLTKQQDDEAYALLSPEEYYAIPDNQKPSETEQQITLTYCAPNIKSLQNDWCVYLVNDLFVGCCKLSQLFMIPDVARSSAFKAIVTNTQSVKITLLGQFPTDKAAIAHRDALLLSGAYLKPESAPSVKADKIRCVTDGTTYRNVPAAATHYAISAQSIYNSINGVRDAPRGLNFERI